MTDSRYPEILADLAAWVEAVLVEEAGFEKAAAGRLARKVADRVGHDWAGQQIYIGRGAVVTERDRQIYRRFDGGNHDELARQFGLTVRQVYNILSKIRTENFEKQQMKLFPE